MKKKKFTERRKATKSRTLFIFEDINKDTSRKFIEKILELDIDKKKRPIKIYLCSPGGSCAYGFAMIDAITRCKCKTIGIATGEVCSMSPAIYVACDERKITGHTFIMLHPEYTGFSDYIEFAKSRLKNAEEVEKMYDEYFLSRTKIPKKKYDEAKNKELWLTVNEAIKYGIAHKVI